MIGALRSGNSYETACSIAEIDPRTFERWRNRSATYEDLELDEVPESERVLVEFCRMAMRARDQAELMLVDIIRTAAVGKKGRTRPLPGGEFIEVEAAIPSDWRAAGWLLERTRPDRFGQKYTIKTEQKEQVVKEMLTRLDIAFAEAGLSEEQRAAIGRRLMEGQADRAKLAS